MGEVETEAERFVREWVENLPPLLPRLVELAHRLDREQEILTTLWVPERSE